MSILAIVRVKVKVKARVAIKWLVVCLSLAPLTSLPQASAATEVNSTFQKVVPGRQFHFPQDHQHHPNFQSEWWYVTANLQGEDGLSYGAQFTLFSNSLMIAGLSQQVYFAHAALSTPERFYHAERYAKANMGHAGVQTKPFRLFLDHWQFTGTDEAPLPGNLAVSEPQFAYQLSLTPAKTKQVYFLQGDNGFSQKNHSGSLASYYYNAPFIDISGTIYFDDKAIKVSGDAWFDREWSSKLFFGQFAGNGSAGTGADADTTQVGWDWLSLHLDDNNALMLYRLNSKEGSNESSKTESYLTGSIMSTSGKQISLSAEQIQWQPTRWKTFKGKKYSLDWRLKIPSQQIDITISPINDDQFQDGLVPYWEGAVTTDGSHSAKGYLELF
ncbi:MAG: putative secreted hydrolase [Phenylobacterium sp.]|jgi:predicted secreted hydrolase